MPTTKRKSVGSTKATNIENTKARLRAEQSQRAADRVAKLKRNSVESTVPPKQSPEQSPEQLSEHSPEYKRPRTNWTAGDETEEESFESNTVPIDTTEQVLRTPVGSVEKQVKVDESHSFREAIRRSRPKTSTPLSSSSSLNHLSYERNSVSPSLQERQHTIPWKQVVRAQLMKVASLLVKLIIITVLAAIFYRVYSMYMASTRSVSYCSRDGEELSSSCSQCPVHGICRNGKLVKCATGYYLSSNWNLFKGDVGIRCEVKFSSRMWNMVGWMLPYMTAFLLVALTWWRRRQNAKKASAQVQNWIRETWSILNSSEEPMPLDWLKQKILMDEFVSQKKVQQNEWLWDKYVCPDLLGDPRLRIEQHAVKGEVMECVTVLSPMAVRPFTKQATKQVRSPSTGILSPSLQMPRIDQPIAPVQERTSSGKEEGGQWTLFGWKVSSSSPTSSPVIIEPPKWR